MSLAPQQKIELMQIARDIAEKERLDEFAARHDLPTKTHERSNALIQPSRMEITLHIYRRLMSEVSEQ